ncbi:putative Ig domain-containing protein [Streptomyces sp. RKAG337]|uniref:putative Ig domain-containing protein n=1 Tax=Streptomyces sp. RKAG337 TaxID=2893404 RepID=UPI0020342C89|nr:putative Ig domain-containing protein [Streptomyces sp. RKAG337]MCM2430560.1 putative Ig domain-containing protein [Streptomyces sp. RKAG337]
MKFRQHTLGAGTLAGTLLAGSLVLIAAPTVSASPIGHPAPQQSEQVTAAKRALDALPAVPNTSWGIDASAGQVVLTVSDAAAGPRLPRLLDTAAALGNLVRVEHTSGRMVQQSTATGDKLQVVGNSGSWCSIGFNVTNGTDNFVLTAGHCKAANGWQTPDGQFIGTTSKVGPNGTDASLVTNALAPDPGAFTGVGTARVGEQVCKKGATSGVTCGTVKAVDQTVTYDNGVVVNHLIQTGNITQSGDSGGGLYDGSAALGLVSGGSDTISSFYPVSNALSDLGVRLVVAGTPGHTVTVTNPGDQSTATGTAVTLQITATDSSPGTTLRYSGSGLPAGLAIDAATGRITGTPTTAGTYRSTVTATETNGPSGSATFTWTVTPPGSGSVTVTNPGNQSSWAGFWIFPVPVQAKASDGHPLAFAAAGLPAGLTIDAATGRITGTPITAGTYRSTVTATEANGPSGSTTFTWTVSGW